MIYGTIEGGHYAVVYNAKKKMGPYRVRAKQAMVENMGGSAIFQVDFSGSDLGIYEAYINVNEWDVYPINHPDVGAFLMELLYPRER